MGIGYKISGGANFAAIRCGVDLAVKGNAEGLFLFGSSEEESARNWVASKPNGIWTGAPTLAANEASFDPSASKYLTTGIDDFNDMTWIMVVRSDQTLGVGQGDPYFASTNTGLSVVGGRSIFGMSMRVEADTGALTLFVPRYNGVSSQNQTLGISAVNSPPMNAWSIIACRYTDTVQKLDDVLRAKAVSAAATVARDRTTNKLRIGSRYGTSTGSGTTRQAAALFYSRALSDGELVTAAIQVKALVEQRGIVFV